MFPDTWEECRVYTNTESTNEDLSIQQRDQDPHHWCQQSPLDHGREQVPAGRYWDYTASPANIFRSITFSCSLRASLQRMCCIYWSYSVYIVLYVGRRDLSIEWNNPCKGTYIWWVRLITYYTVCTIIRQVLFLRIIFINEQLQCSWLIQNVNKPQTFLICWWSTFCAATTASQTLFKEVLCFPSL